MHEGGKNLTESFFISASCWLCLWRKLSKLIELSCLLSICLQLMPHIKRVKSFIFLTCHNVTNSELLNQAAQKSVTIWMKLNIDLYSSLTWLAWAGTRSQPINTGASREKYPHLRERHPHLQEIFRVWSVSPNASVSTWVRQAANPVVPD